MGLKSYKVFKSRKQQKKKKKLSDVGSLVIGGTVALLGIGLLSETSNAVNRI